MYRYCYKSIVLLVIWKSASQRRSYITMANERSCSTTPQLNNPVFMVNSTLITGTYW